MAQPLAYSTNWLAPSSIHDMLLKHWPSINAVEGSEVIVPLCGKSLDMLWLAEQGYSVVGLEMVEEAVMAFS